VLGPSSAAGASFTAPFFPVEMHERQSAYPDSCTKPGKEKKDDEQYVGIHWRKIPSEYDADQLPKTGI
jgi:hypothetical protein